VAETRQTSAGHEERGLSRLPESATLLVQRPGRGSDSGSCLEAPGLRERMRAAGGAIFLGMDVS